VSMTGTIDRLEVITLVQRRRWSAEEKAAMVQETYTPGISGAPPRKKGQAPRNALASQAPAIPRRISRRSQ
jgi:hypothetical protein